MFFLYLVFKEKKLLAREKAKKIRSLLQEVGCEVVVRFCGGKSENVRLAIRDAVANGAGTVILEFPGFGPVEEEIACLELGANDFVVKPYNFEILMNRVTNLIHLKESVVIVNELRWDQVTGLLTKEELDGCFTLDYYFKNVDYIFDRVGIKKV